MFSKRLLVILFLSSHFSFFTSVFAQENVQTGKASYYSSSFTGRKTASGERLSQDSMTCAHKSYKFGTFLKVTSKATGKSVVVRVNDRGPYVRGRIVDLSIGAAKRLGIFGTGVAHVTIEEVQPIDDKMWLDLNAHQLAVRPYETYDPLQFLHSKESEDSLKRLNSGVSLTDTTSVERPLPLAR